jgi:hypothetical protein
MNAIAKRTASPVPVLQLTNFAELVQFSQIAAKSKLVPPEYRGQPESIMLAVQLGSELGLSPMQSIQNIAVIGSRPTVWGDAMLALVLAHPDCQDVVETSERGTAVCTVKRRGRAPIVRRFSTDDAKLAQLWGKTGPWSTYPVRMLQMRARGFALRDAFPDVLKGLITAEEARDIPPHRGPTIHAVAEPVQIDDHAAVHGPDDDSIPALDDEPSAESTLRAEINAAVPLAQKKPTVAAWLDQLAERLNASNSREETEAAVLCDEVYRAGRVLTGVARDKLRAIIDAAMAKHSEAVTP